MLINNTAWRESLSIKEKPIWATREVKIKVKRKFRKKPNLR